MNENNEYVLVQEKKPLSIWAKIACMLWPIIGIILYFVWKKDENENANAAIKFAVIGVVITVAISILCGLSTFLLAVLANV